MLKIDCHLCEKELDHPGALLFSPPNTGVCAKLHLCGSCWRTLKRFMEDQRRSKRASREGK